MKAELTASLYCDIQVAFYIEKETIKARYPLAEDDYICRLAWERTKEKYL